MGCGSSKPSTVAPEPAFAPAFDDNARYKANYSPEQDGGGRPLSGLLACPRVERFDTRATESFESLRIRIR